MATVKLPKFWQALLPMIILLFTALMSGLKWKAGMDIPLVVGIIAAAILGIFLKHKWSDLEKFIIEGIYKGIFPCLLLFIIGAIIATWMQSGVIPSLIYYSLKLIDPHIFIPIVGLTTAILSVSIGSSFTTIATIGVAFMVVGQGMGFPPALVAGAVISGSYFGDKLSPLSETTNLEPVVCDTDLISHVKHMLWDTIPALFISIVIYYFVGLHYSTTTANLHHIKNIMNVLEHSFNLSSYLLLLPVLTIVLIIKRFPILPTLIFISVIGGIVAMVVQGNSLTQVILTVTNGFSSHTGLNDVDSLLNRGGLLSMLDVIMLIILSTALGGIMDGIGIFKAIIQPIVQKARRTGSLIFLTVVSTLIVGFASGSQHLSIILSGQGFTKTYKERGLDTKNLSRCVAAGGAVGINLVPWSVNAFFGLAMLKVNPIDYIPFSYFVILVPLINIIYGFTGFSIVKIAPAAKNPSKEPELQYREENM
ncbi:Na+/H+ antiporter NhaC [Scopulibacillus cellulosilyticus]|uniref:Na+/H+ antiporter NhaC n=1 Tax=Scopulibacillus cellulosilyticus TaxID=2665665 RepID=A0ABW2PRQ8_9BACL